MTPLFSRRWLLLLALLLLVLAVVAVLLAFPHTGILHSVTSGSDIINRHG